MKFIHIGDCHLGGWKQPVLNDLNFKSFQLAINAAIKEKVDFMLIAGDLFDAAYPPIETLKDTFNEFRKLYESKIPVFLIAGSHDYSVSGKTFLEVLEKAGFCKNVSIYEEKDGYIYLHPTINKNVAIYGYPGKKAGLEVDEISRIKIQDSPGLFKILMLHTTIRDAIGNLPVNAVDEKTLPKVNYLALSHLHINYNKNGRVYSGPIFPTNIGELEELQGGSFYVYNNGSIERREIRLKEIKTISYQLSNAFTALNDIKKMLDKENLKDKIVILRLYGILEQGKFNDIEFNKIEEFAKSKGAFIFLKSTSKLYISDPKVQFDLLDSSNLESQIISKFEESHPSRFNVSIDSIIRTLQIEKLEDEKSSVFEERLISETKKVMGI